MKKIISLFQRNYETDRLVRDEVVPGAEWVLAGEGVPTEKIDGTSCMIDANVRLFKRRDLKPGKKEPAGFICVDTDKRTGRKWGWVPVGDGPEDKWHREAFGDPRDTPWKTGTYELIGPKVQGNPYNLGEHRLVRHGRTILTNCPRDFESLKASLLKGEIEGVVWHHDDGRMVKIKANVFAKGVWPPKKKEGAG